MQVLHMRESLAFFSPFVCPASSRLSSRSFVSLFSFFPLSLFFLFAATMQKVWSYPGSSITNCRSRWRAQGPYSLPHTFCTFFHMWLSYISLWSVSQLQITEYSTLLSLDKVNRFESACDKKQRYLGLGGISSGLGGQLEAGAKCYSEIGELICQLKLGANFPANGEGRSLTYTLSSRTMLF